MTAVTAFADAAIHLTILFAAGVLVAAVGVWVGVIAGWIGE